MPVFFHHSRNSAHKESARKNPCRVSLILGPCLESSFSFSNSRNSFEKIDLASSPYFSETKSRSSPLSVLSPSIISSPKAALGGNSSKISRGTRLEEAEVR